MELSESRNTATDPEQQALEALDREDYKAVLTLLMQAYGNHLYRFCCQLVGNEELAEDVHQMTFVQAYEGLPRFARRSSLRTWLFGIARHRGLDALKILRRRRARFQQVATLPDSADTSDDVEDRLTARSRTQVLERCLQKLAPGIRAAVLLRYQAETSYPEMSRICHERPATLQARVARALPLLRRCLENQGLGL